MMVLSFCGRCYVLVGKPSVTSGHVQTGLCFFVCFSVSPLVRLPSTDLEP